MRILILGGTKFFGKAFAKAMAERGHDVTVFSRSMPKDLHPEIKKIKGQRADLSPVKGERWDFVLDNICYTKEEMQGAIDNFTNIGHYVFVSTGDVHLAVDGAKSPFPEDIAHTLPEKKGKTDAYGKGKFEAEKLLKSSALPYTIVRFPIVIGPGDPKDRLFKYISRIESGEPVILPDNGIYRRRFIYVNDCVDALERVMSRKERVLGEVLQFGDKEITLRDFIALCYKIMGKKENLLKIPSEKLREDGYDLALENPYFNPFDYVLITRKAEKLLHWHPADMKTWLKNTIEQRLF